MSCKFGAVYARTFVVEISSVGNEIWARSMGLMPYRLLLDLEGIGRGASSWLPALYRFVKALARDMAMSRADPDGEDVSGTLEVYQQERPQRALDPPRM